MLANEVNNTKEKRSSGGDSEQVLQDLTGDFLTSYF